jgi:threonine/homoserine/homoserine lactone efflux protein
MEIIVGIAFIHLLAALSPGPDILLVILNSLRHGRWQGVATTAGILCGVSLHITLGISGLTLLITQVPAARPLITLAGAAWLTILALRSLRPSLKAATATGENTASTGPVSISGFWLQGLLVNLLNAKALLFFLSLFSVALGPEVPLSIRLTAGITMVVVQGLAFCSVACLIDYAPVRRLWERGQRPLEIAVAMVLLLIALWMLGSVAAVLLPL